MCVFCAAIPVTLSFGAVAKAKRREHNQEVETGDVSQSKRSVSVETVTGAVVAGLVVSAVVYHTVVAPKIGIW